MPGFTKASSIFPEARCFNSCNYTQNLNKHLNETITSKANIRKTKEIHLNPTMIDKIKGKRKNMQPVYHKQREEHRGKH